MQQRLLQTLDQVRRSAAVECCTRLPAGVDVAYETGFRHGRADGIERAIAQMIVFYRDTDSKDKDL